MREADRRPVVPAPEDGGSASARLDDAEAFWARLASDTLVTSAIDALRGRPELERALRRFAALDLEEAGFTFVDGPAWYRVRIRREGDAVAELAATRRPRAWGLTTRELDVLTLIACGLTNQQIARRLSVSESTVGTHVEHLLDKSGQRSRGALAALASEKALLRLPVPGEGTEELPSLAVVLLTETAADAAAIAASAEQPRRRPRRSPYRVGAVYPDSEVGADMLRGAQLAVEQLNAQGGIGGEPVELHAEIACDAADVVRKFARLVDDGASALSAVRAHGAVDPLLDFARDADVPFLHALGTGSALRVRRRPAEVANVFQLCPGPDVYLPEMLRFLREQRLDPGAGRVVVLVPDPDAFPAAPLPRRCDDASCEFVVVASSDAAAATAAMLAEDAPDAVLVHLFDQDVVCDVLDAIFEAGPPTLVFALWLPGTHAFPVERYEGLCWLSDVGRYDDPVSARFERTFSARFGIRPGIDAGVQYDGVDILARAWRATGRSCAPRAVHDEVRRTVHRGVNGAYYLDTPGQAVLAVPRDTADPSLGQRTVVFQVQDGVSRAIRPVARGGRGLRTLVPSA